MTRLENGLDLVVRASQLGEYDSNVIGMAAEIIAEEEFGMVKTPRGRRDVSPHRGRARRKAREVTPSVHSVGAGAPATGQQTLSLALRLRRSAIRTLSCVAPPRWSR